jgi:hypothetical protein
MGSKSALLRTLVAASSAKSATFGVARSVPKWRAILDADRALALMKTLVRRLRRMNDILEKIDRAKRSSADPSERAADRSHTVHLDTKTRTLVKALQEKGFQIRPRLGYRSSTRFYSKEAPCCCRQHGASLDRAPISVN